MKILIFFPNSINKTLEQWSPTFLAPGTIFVEDSFSTDVGMVQAVMQVTGSDGERQMKFGLLAHHSPPAVQPGS